MDRGRQVAWLSGGHSVCTTARWSTSISNPKLTEVESDQVTFGPGKPGVPNVRIDRVRSGSLPTSAKNKRVAKSFNKDHPQTLHGTAIYADQARGGFGGQCR